MGVDTRKRWSRKHSHTWGMREGRFFRITSRSTRWHSEKTIVVFQWNSPARVFRTIFSLSFYVCKNNFFFHIQYTATLRRSCRTRIGNGDGGDFGREVSPGGEGCGDFRRPHIVLDGQPVRGGEKCRSRLERSHENRFTWRPWTNSFQNDLMHPPPWLHRPPLLNKDQWVFDLKSDKKCGTLKTFSQVFGFFLVHKVFWAFYSYFLRCNVVTEIKWQTWRLLQILLTFIWL